MFASGLLYVCAINVAAYIYLTYTISEILGSAAFLLLIASMRQHDIIKLRLIGACAGLCFTIQFTLSDLPLVNIIGQGSLVIYGIFQAYREIQEKKRVDKAS